MLEMVPYWSVLKYFVANGSTAKEQSGAAKDAPTAIIFGRLLSNNNCMIYFPKLRFYLLLVLTSFHNDKRIF